MAKEVEKRSGKATRQRYKKDRREAVVQVRMNAEELALLDGKRGGRTRSNYLRGALYGSAGSHTEHEVVADTPQLDRMLMELNRIGVNINQIARAFSFTCRPDAEGISTVESTGGLEMGLEKTFQGSFPGRGGNIEKSTSTRLWDDSRKSFRKGSRNDGTVGFRKPLGGSQASSPMPQVVLR